MTDNDIMPFGMHKGKKLRDVPASHLMWLHMHEPWMRQHKHGKLFVYIDNNMPILEEKLEKEKIERKKSD